jgi:hypothetical protein
MADESENQQQPGEASTASACSPVSRSITLCGVPHIVTDHDGQTIFENDSGFWGCYDRFTFQWNGVGWDMVDFDTSSGRLYAPHIRAALEWVERWYEIEWNDGTGTVRLKENA